MSKVAEMQRLIHYFKETTLSAEVNMHAVVDFAVANGWPLPKPTDPRDRLAKEFSDAARQEVRYDRKTSRPYRANHAVTEMRNGKQLTLWIDIDEAPRRTMHKAWCSVESKWLAMHSSCRSTWTIGTASI